MHKIVMCSIEWSHGKYWRLAKKGIFSRRSIELCMAEMSVKFDTYVSPPTKCSFEFQRVPRKMLGKCQEVSATFD